MTYLFDTTTTDDLTDAQIQTMCNAVDSGYTARYIRNGSGPTFRKVTIALARLMRDHPELFEEPVDPLLVEARGMVAKWYRDDPSGFFSQDAERALAGDEDAASQTVGLVLEAIKRGMELAKPAEPEWIDWHGGECPVPAGSDCEVRFRDGRTGRDTEPEDWQWRHRQHSHDIVAYRVWS